jgi:hypothetical protein
MDYEPALPAYSDTEGNSLIGLFFLVQLIVESASLKELQLFDRLRRRSKYVTQAIARCYHGV